MKTLNELAAKFDLYQVKDIGEAWKKDKELFDHRIKCGTQIIPEFMLTLPTYEVGLFYQCQIQDKGTAKEIHYIEHSYIIVRRKDNDLLMMLKQERNNKYYLYPYYNYMHKYHDIDYNLRNTATKGMNEPNHIGVFTEKKVNDWTEYCVKFIAAHENLLTSVNDKNTGIENEITDFIASVQPCEVDKWQNRYTDVTTEHFKVRFEHFRDQNYLNTQITFKGTLKDIAELEKSISIPA